MTSALLCDNKGPSAFYQQNFKTALTLKYESNTNTKGYIQTVTTDKYYSQVHIGCRAIAVFWIYQFSVTSDGR